MRESLDNKIIVVENETIAQLSPVVLYFFLFKLHSRTRLNTRNNTSRQQDYYKQCRHHA